MWLQVYVILSLLSIIISKETEHCDANTKDCHQNVDPAEKYRSNDQEDKDPNLVKMAKEHFSSQRKNMDRPPPNLDLNAVGDIVEKMLSGLNIPNMNLETVLGLMQTFATQGGDKSDGMKSLLQMAEMFMKMPQKETSVRGTKENQPSPVKQILDFMSKKENQALVMSLMQNENIAKTMMPLLQSMTGNKDDLVGNLVGVFMENFNVRPQLKEKPKQENTKIKEKPSKTKKIEKEQQHKKVTEKKMKKEKVDRSEKKQDPSIELNADTIKSMVNMLEASQLLDKTYANVVNNLVDDLPPEDNSADSKNSFQLSSLLTDSESWYMLWDLGACIIEALQEPEATIRYRIKANKEKYKAIVYELINEKGIRKSDANKYFVTWFGLYKDKSKKPISEAIADFSDLLDVAYFLKDDGNLEGTVDFIEAINVDSVRRSLAIIQNTYQTLKTKLALDTSDLWKLVDIEQLKVIRDSALKTIKNPNLITIQETSLLVFDYFKGFDLEVLTRNMPAPLRQQVMLLIVHLKNLIQQTDWVSIMMYVSNPKNRESLQFHLKEHFTKSCIEMWTLSKATFPTIPCLCQKVCEFVKRKSDLKQPAKSMTFWAGALTSIATALTMTDSPSEVTSVYLAATDGGVGIDCSKKYKC